MSFDSLPVAAGQRSNTGIRLADQDAMGGPFSFQYKSALLLAERSGMRDLDDHRDHLPVGETNHAPVLYRLHPARPDNGPGALHLFQRIPLKPFR